jgi:hypothetical protein
MAVGGPPAVLEKMHRKMPPPIDPSEIPVNTIKPWQNIRLPTFARPVHYKLLLQPDLLKKTFRGEKQSFLYLYIVGIFVELNFQSDLHNIIVARPSGNLAGNTPPVRFPRFPRQESLNLIIDTVCSFTWKKQLEFSGKYLIHFEKVVSHMACSLSFSS